MIIYRMKNSQGIKVPTAARPEGIRVLQPKRHSGCSTRKSNGVIARQSDANSKAIDAHGMRVDCFARLPSVGFLATTRFICLPSLPRIPVRYRSDGEECKVSERNAMHERGRVSRLLHSNPSTRIPS